LTRLSVVPETGQGPLVTLVGDYLASCKARGLSPNTLQNSYGYPLRKVLLPFCKREGISDVAGLTGPGARSPGRRVARQGGERGPLSRHSVHAYMRAINHLLAWAKREGEPVQAKAQLPRLPNAVLEVLSREEIQAMEDRATAERDKLILRTLADTGMRVGELVRLRTTDVVSQGRQHYLRSRAAARAAKRRATGRAWSRSRASTRACAGTRTGAGRRT
jgi:integrase